jgi:hypothetical protein
MELSICKNDRFILSADRRRPGAVPFSVHRPTNHIPTQFSFSFDPLPKPELDSYSFSFGLASNPPKTKSINELLLSRKRSRKDD